MLSASWSWRIMMVIGAGVVVGFAGGSSQVPEGGARSGAEAAASDISMSMCCSGAPSAELWVELESSVLARGPVIWAPKVGVEGAGAEGVAGPEPTICGGGGADCSIEAERIQLRSSRNRSSSRGGLP